MNVDGVILVSASQNRINVRKRLELGGFGKLLDTTRPIFRVGDYELQGGNTEGDFAYY